MKIPMVVGAEDPELDFEEGASTVTLLEHTLVVTPSRVSWTSSKSAEESVDTCDILGCIALDGPPRLQIVTAARQKAREFICGFGGNSRARKRESHELPCKSLEQASSAATTVSRMLRVPEGRRRVLVLINPFGGGGKAPGVWSALERLLRPAGLTLEVIRTTHAGHAREVASQLAVGDYELVVTVSGDGLVYEFVNGMMNRADAATAAASLPIFPAPGGTSNGLFRSICAQAGEVDNLLGAAMLIARGTPVPLDVWRYSRPAEPSAVVGWSVLSLSWGIIADVDIESEQIRSCGSVRMTLWGLLRIATMRRYAGTLHYLDAASGEWRSHQSARLLGIWACNVPYMTQTDLAAPLAQLSNGLLDVLVFDGTTRLQALSFFLGIEGGKHISADGSRVAPGVTLIRCKGFRLEPAPRTAKCPGLVDLDGELVEFGPLEATAHPAAMRVLGRPLAD